MRTVYRDTEAMGDPLSSGSDKLFQLYIYLVSAVCLAGSDEIFAVYSVDEGSAETAGSGCYMEKSLQGLGLGVFSNDLKNR